ncbi:MAG: nucleotidyltransferase substrate binding protein [Bacillota bacterium]
MDKGKVKEKLHNYTRAVERLRESLARDENDDIVLDGVIQRFEFTYELSWKLLKTYLAYTGIAEIRTPREAFKEAFAAGLIVNGDIWLEMIDDRNLTSHNYDETEARRIFERIKNKYFRELSKLKEIISKEMEQ